jgi:prepilin-type N-terminal cleavage/methylation domain-containing protein
MKQAFTLIETMVALVIFAMISVVLGSAYLNVLNSYAVVGRGHEDDQEIAFCRQELLAQPDYNTAVAGDQYTAVDGSQVQWSAAIDAQGGATDLFTVVLTVQIAPNLQAEPRVITQTFTVLRPTWSLTGPDPTVEASERTAAATRIGQLQGTVQ